MGVQDNVPVAGLPVVLVNVVPPGKMANRLTLSDGSGSNAETGIVIAVPTRTVCREPHVGAVNWGGWLTCPQDDKDPFQNESAWKPPWATPRSARMPGATSVQLPLAANGPVKLNASSAVGPSLKLSSVAVPTS